MAYAHGIDEPENPAKLLAELTLIILEACKKDLSVIDFDDMIWLPAVLDLKPKCYDTVFVDEAQDLNACQRWMVEGTLRRGGRIVAVGDDRQAIYKWRGAGGDVLTDIQNQFGAAKLPLSLTYRCPKKVVALAKRIVPDFEALPDAPEGEILHKVLDDVSVEARPDDLVLSRVNGPLLSVCLALIEQDIPAKVRGKDIGKSLSALARKSKTVTTKELAAWLIAYRAKEKERLLPDHEDAFSILQDKVYCLEILLRKHDTVTSLCKKIEEIFSDSDSSGYVLCSTVHKAKGMERRKVWVLLDTFRHGGGNREEDNIYYVAITRAQQTLIMVGGGSLKPKAPSGEEKLVLWKSMANNLDPNDDFEVDDEEDDDFDWADGDDYSGASFLDVLAREDDEDAFDEDEDDDRDDDVLDW
jgi:superfamily I DNA/RNA helicase